MIDFALIWKSLPALLQGTAISLQITALSAGIGLILGLFLGIGEVSPWRLVRVAVGGYVMLFRGTPMLVQVLFVYYVLPQFGVVISPFWAASIALGLNSSAYISQVVRSGLNAVPRGQVEAARALGFSRWGTLRHVVLPQAFRYALPALGNDIVTLVKDSSLASIIGVMELSKEASLIRSRTYDAFSVLLAIGVIYLVLTTVLSLVLKWIERRGARHA